MVHSTVSSPIKIIERIKEYSWVGTKHILDKDNDLSHKKVDLHQLPRSKILEDDQKDDTFSALEMPEGKGKLISYNFTERIVSVIKEMEIEDDKNSETTISTNTEENLTGTEIVVTQCEKGTKLLDGECKTIGSDNIIQTPSLRRRCSDGKRLDIFGQCKEPW